MSEFEYKALIDGCRWVSMVGMRKFLIIDMAGQILVIILSRYADYLPQIDLNLAGICLELNFYFAVSILSFNGSTTIYKHS